MLDLKTEKGAEYVTCWKSKGLFECKIPPLRNAFMSNVKPFG